MPAREGVTAQSPQTSASRGNFTPPTPAAPPPGGPDDSGGISPPPGATRRFALRNWRVPTRLLAILAIPVVTGLVFAGLRVADSVETARQAADAERAARLAHSATSLVNALEYERDVSVLPLSRGDRNSNDVKNARAETDERLAQFRADAARIEGDTGVRNRVRAAEATLGSLDSLRQDAFSSDLAPTATITAYSDLFRPLNAFTNELGSRSTGINSRGRAMYAISLAKASASTQRAAVQVVLARDRLSTPDAVTIQAATTLKSVAVEEFTAGALPQDVRLYNRTVQSPSLDDANTYMRRVLAVNPGDSLAEAGLRPTEWFKLSSVEFDLMRKVELQITNEIVAESAQAKTDAERDAIINGAAALAMLLLAGLLTFFVSRSMVRGMATLRGSAMDIAEVRLPGLVENLSKTDPGRVDTRVEPIPLFGRDEIGQVARAFDQVHREAVRLAAEQALLRGNVNAIFTNLSRRNQGLIQRQLSLITDLENNETDPDQLENLFKLDHLATRMRRNGENLLVLAGEEPGRRWNQPVPLVDVLRAAASEVEQYERIELSGVPDTEIHGTAVNDLVHLLAELLENATSFSSPQTKVRVNGTRLPDGRVMVEIHDKGIGLTAEDFADINHKLSNPPTVDVSIARRMGLFVVGRLAQRHDIRVQLRPSGESAGTTSLVMLPEPITHGGAAPDEEADFQVSRIVPEQNPQNAAGAVRSAAELGFDDSRYTAVEGDAALDPVGRSLQRRERRAALDAAGRGEAPAPEQRTGQAGGFDGGAGAPGQPPYLDDRYAASEFPAAPAYEDTGQFAVPQASYEDTGQFAAPQASYEDTGQFAAPQAPYEDTGQFATPQAPYEENPGQEGAPYGEGSGYEEPSSSYAGGGHPDGGDWPADPGYADGYRSGFGQGFPEQRPYPGAASPEESGYGDPGGQEPPAYPGGYGQDAYQGYADQGRKPSSQPSAPAGDGDGGAGYGDAADRQSVSFTESGLPRRQPKTPRQTPSGSGNGPWHQRPAEEPPAPAAPQVPDPAQGAAPQGAGAEGATNDEWRSDNDNHWQRASQVREPRAGGVTASGLPRRVPKANLIPGSAQHTPQDGPQVSRTPEEIRGRLTSLRRGVQQGRQQSSDSNGEGLGPNHQER
ncbi:nitrate- and nitrite sensing domain-containing protein [Streptomyces capparidis]